MPEGAVLRATVPATSHPDFGQRGRHARIRAALVGVKRAARRQGPPVTLLVSP
jgi:hypothetical protein